MRTKFTLTGLFLLVTFLFSILSASAQVKGDYRTKANGDWGSLSVWERFNGISWLAPTASEGVPDTSGGSISIIHQISLTSSTIVRRLTINSGSLLTIGSDVKLSILNGTGTDLSVLGTLVNSGELDLAGTASFGPNALYKHVQPGGRLPQNAAWDPNSLIEFSYKGEVKPQPLKTSVVFGRMIVKKNSSVILNGETSGSSLKVSFANGSGTDLIVEDEATLSLENGVDSFVLIAGTSAEIQGILANKTVFNLSSDDNLVKVSNTGVIENEGKIHNAGYAKLQFAKGSLYEHKQDGGNIPNANWHPESDCRITGVKKIYPEGMNQVFGNLEFNVALAADLIMQGSLDCEGDLVISNSTGYRFIVNASEKHQTVFIGGSLFLNKGNFYVVSTKGKGSVNVGGDYIQDLAVNLFLKSESGDASLFISNDFNKKGGNILLRSRDTAATEGNATITVKKNYFHQGGVINFSPIGGSSYLEVGGDYTNIGQLSENGDGSGEVIFNGNNVQYLFSGGNSLNEINFTVLEKVHLQFAMPASIIMSGGTFTAKAGATLGIKHTQGILNEDGMNGHIRTSKRKYENGIHFIYNGITAQNAGDGFYESVPASLTIDNPYYLNIAQSSKVTGDINILQGQLYTGTGAELSVGGNWINDGNKTDQKNSFVVFTGNQIQSVGGKAGTIFGSLKINNPAGLNLFQDVSIFNSLGIYSGIVYLNDYNLTLYPNVNAIAGAPFSTKNMIVTSGKGEIRKEALKASQASYLYPVGDTTGEDQYSPVTVEFADGKYDGYLAVKVKNARHPENPSNDNYLNRYWTIHQTGFTGFNARVITTFDSSDITGKKELIQMAKYNEQNDSIPWSSSGIIPSGNELIYENVTSFSDFTGIGIVVIVPPAPAKRTMTNTYINTGTNAERVNPSNGASTIKIYPNPVQGPQVALIMLNIKPGRYQMVITNNLGQRIYSAFVEHGGGTITTKANLPGEQPAGIYRVQLLSEKERYNTTYLQQ